MNILTSQDIHGIDRYKTNNFIACAKSPQGGCFCIKTGVNCFYTRERNDFPWMREDFWHEAREVERGVLNRT